VIRKSGHPNRRQTPATLKFIRRGDPDVKNDSLGSHERSELILIMTTWAYPSGRNGFDATKKSREYFSNTADRTS
jgi:hypothetical protein